MFSPLLIRDWRFRRLGVNCQWGTTFFATDGLVIFSLGAIMIGISMVTRILQNVRMAYTSCLRLRAAHIAWGVGSWIFMIVVTSRIASMSSSSTTSRRELGNI
jgi:hypothetical protein